GFAFINVISPCVTFNNNAGSTKSYDYVREHMEATATVDYVQHRTVITADYDEGSVEAVQMHDGSMISLHKLDENWDPLDRLSAINAVQNARAKGEILTGLLYVNPETTDLHEMIQTNKSPLNKLTQSDLCPGSKTLEAINASLR
ncbi:MAG TPA: hypothetical protein PK108_14350, partial [Pyrinomonadaceae bacterium]|nr:hypothetical protein [Pyrinomonadaceae bacterium]